MLADDDGHLIKPIFFRNSSQCGPIFFLVVGVVIVVVAVDGVDGVVGTAAPAAFAVATVALGDCVSAAAAAAADDASRATACGEIARLAAGGEQSAGDHISTVCSRPGARCIERGVVFRHVFVASDCRLLRKPGAARPCCDAGVGVAAEDDVAKNR